MWVGGQKRPKLNLYKDDVEFIQTVINDPLKSLKFGHILVIQTNLDLRKILVAAKIFLKSRFFPISNIRNNLKKLLLSHRFAKSTFEGIKMSDI